jgi:AcrR family transcriptional regulator
MSTKKDETRLRLLDAARKLLVKRGFHGIGLEDIAQAAGVSRQAIYKSHFASKADLLLELVQHVHVAENLDELTRPVFAAQSALAMLEETIRAIVKIETRLHDLALVLSTAALSDADAAAAWRDRMEVKRGAFRAALSRVEAEGRFNAAWKLEEAIDVSMTLVSVDAYQQLVVERGWKDDAMIRRVWEICAGNFVVEPRPRKAGAKDSARAR